MKRILIIVASAVAASALAYAAIPNKCMVCKGTGWNGQAKCGVCGGDGDTAN